MVVKGDPQVWRLQRACQYLFPDRCRVVVAVSGGADSLALLHLLVASELRPCDALLVAHFDHGLRSDSGDDARFVVEEANKLGLAWVVELWQPVATKLGNLAGRARQARYDFLLRCALRFGATRIVTGHHQDDQAETFLERLLRGSGVRGLGAMQSVRVLAKDAESEVTLVRPLLSFSRAEIRRWLTQHGLDWREDPSNRKPTARRNRIRHEALPILQEIADGGVAQRLAATAERMAQADTALEWVLLRLWPEWDPQMLDSGKLSLSAVALLALPDELLCRCLHRCHRQLSDDWQPPSSRAVAGFVYLLRSRRRHWSMVMRGLAVQRQQGRIVFQATEGVLDKASKSKMDDTSRS